LYSQHKYCFPNKKMFTPKISPTDVREINFRDPSDKSVK
jgi:hypothetical protein